MCGKFAIVLPYFAVLWDTMTDGLSGGELFA